MSCCNIFETFDLDSNFIKEYEHWFLIVRKNHVCLGSCVAITKKHHELLGDLSSQEMSEYQLIANEVESALKKSFQFDVIHHLVLMVKDKHTHFHIIPRYINSRKFAGLEWVDDISGTPIGKKNIVQQATLNLVKEQIKNSLE
jgi:diadenosine tetraphosphate (Ap4A) HIT family hydrolase